MLSSLEHSAPPWLAELMPAPGSVALSAGELLRLSLAVAAVSVRNGGGPFGAVLADADGRVIEIGWNAVTSCCDSTAHAEIVCLRRAQKKLGTHDLSSLAGPAVLYSSCDPCILCFGAIYWSGVREVVAAARKADAERIGFDEGPVSEALWLEAERKKGIRLSHGEIDREAALSPFALFTKLGGMLY